MDSHDWQRIQTLFHAALDLEPAARQAWLEARDDSPAVVDEVRSMLEAHGDGHTLDLEGGLPALNPESTPAPWDPEALLDTVVGPHRLVRHLGRGGMGDVYLGERDDDQFRQRVAIKVVRPGIGSPDLALRFRAERQILARLTHPHIAPLLDGGMTDDGRPYLVMPYLEGLPLNTFCQQHQLSLDARLELFLQVCDAVQLAHRNLVVHRDLKPSNILVIPSDDDRPGIVQLLDFGIAKLLDPESLGLSVAATRSEIRVMTPEYAAPEQVRGEAITTSTDVYALGVVLYELLTGHRPVTVDGLSPAEIERQVCDTQPRRPSTAVEAATETDPSSHVQRRQLAGDLDNIVLEALRKEPARRYASVEALADDLRRFRTGRPVSARPDTVTYRVGKFVRRNRGAVLAAGLLVLLLAGFGIAMAVQASRLAQHAEALEAERDRVRRQVETTTRVKTLVSELFRVLDPNELGGDPTERLQAASQRIVEDLAGENVLQAELMDELVTIYRNLGLYEQALEMAESSLELRKAAFPDDDPAIARGLYRLGETLYYTSRFPDASQHIQDALTRLRALPGDHDLAIADGLLRMAQIHRAKHESEPSESKANEAWQLYRAKLGDEHPKTVEALYNLALGRGRTGGDEAAEPLLRQTIELQRQIFDPQHPDIAWTLVDLGALLIRQQRFDEADEALAEALTIQTLRYGRDHPDTSRTLVLLGRLHKRWRQLEEAESYYREALEARRQRLGHEHIATSGAMVEVALVLLEQQVYPEAESLLLEALPIHRRLHPPGHRWIRVTLENLVKLYEATGRPEDAVEFRQQLEVAEETGSR